jgi:LacI family transcriptional regulator
MGKRPTIQDLAEAAGVSVATVDRVLNRRHPVREETTARVLAAAETIGYHAAALIKQRLEGEAPARTLLFLLQKRRDYFYQQLAAHLQAATRQAGAIRGKAIVEFVDELVPAVIAERLRGARGRADAVAVVSVDHPHVNQAVAALAEDGVPTIAILSDLTTPARAGYVGRDTRKEGRTAGWMIARTARRPGRVGIIVGSYRYLSQEAAEISFRSYFREHAPTFSVLEPLVNLEEARIANEATLHMIEANPDLAGLYICGGGQEGVIEALRAEAGARDLVVVCNELTPVTRAGLIDGVLTAVISTPLRLLAERTVEAMVRALLPDRSEPPGQVFVPSELYIPENI